MGSNITCEIDGIRDITLKFENGFIYILERVRYMPNLNRNLISKGDLEGTGLQGRIGNGY